MIENKFRQTFSKSIWYFTILMFDIDFHTVSKISILHLKMIGIEFQKMGKQLVYQQIITLNNKLTKLILRYSS